MNSEQVARFMALVSDEVSDVISKADWREENSGWLEHAQNIALEVLHLLDDKNMTKQELARKMGVSQSYISRIVKGSENLSLKTISKLETALNENIISVSDSEKMQPQSYVVHVGHIQIVSLATPEIPSANKQYTPYRMSNPITTSSTTANEGRKSVQQQYSSVI